MPNYLVIAHQTARSPQLIDALREKQGADSATEFVLLVPVTPYEDLRTAQEGSPRDIARRAAAGAAEVLRGSGIRLRWTVISEYTAAVALDSELNDHPSEYAGVILSTYPEGASRWMMDHVAERATRHGIPVTQVVTDVDLVR